MTQKIVAISIEICGDYSVINRCGECQSLNIQTDDTDRAVCPDCGTTNLVPLVSLCECKACTKARNSAMKSLKAVH